MGPVEFLVLAFPGESPGDGALAALRQLSSAGDVQVVDTLLVSREADGTVTTAELADAPADQLDLIGAEDAEEIAQTLEPGYCALAVLVEHVWAANAAEAVRTAGGRLAASVRIPYENVEQAVAGTGA
jgi:uncharacterized membrane protein